jgi:putative tryptophan/tyrosine transport system substrate-binding protein
VPSGYARGVLGVAVLSALPVSVSLAQSVPVLGYVAAKNANPERLEVFKRGLTELGYIEGKNIRIDYREAVLDGEYNSAMAELVDLRVRIILAANVAAEVEAAKATASIWR